MYLEFFKLWDEPFGVTPDPAYLYPSQTHLRALDSLRNGILGGRGFMTLIADPGMGKTTLLYQLIEQMPQTTRTAYLFQTQCNSLEFMQYLLSELGVDPNGMGLVAMHRRLNETLFDEMVNGKQFVLIVDESQNLSNTVLETIRLLSNFETSHSKLLQIVLAGQPELAAKLKQSDLSQLMQRITVMAHLEAFSFEETAAYICHRLKMAGHAGEDLFDRTALAAIYRRSQGIPRNINRVCHAALSLAQAEGTHTVTAALVERSNRSLGDPFEQLEQQPSSASQPEQVAFAKPSPRVSPPSSAPASPVAAPSAQIKRTAPAESTVPPISPATRQPPVAAPQIFPHELPDFVPQQPRPRSYRWLAWIAVVVTASILGALAAPTNVRRALLQKLQPMVGSTSSINGSGSSAVSDGVSSPTPMAAGNHSETDGATNPASIKGMKIVIDAGHGGTESGTRGPNGLLEKGVCLEVALRLGQIIEDNLPGTDVIYTRSDDQSLSPQRRVAIANESDADLFISIHADSPADSQGLQVYYSAEDTKKESAASESGDAIGRASLQLAGDVESSLAQVFALKRETTPKPASAQPPFAILNGIHVPAIVAEIPFSENDSPLLDPAQRQRLAEGLYRGVATFLKGLQAGAHPRIRP